MCGVVAVDVNTTTDQNLNVIQWETGVDPLATSLAKLREAIVSLRQGEMPIMLESYSPHDWRNSKFVQQLEVKMFFMDDTTIY